MLLLVGLGNPGSQYVRNRHNIGFMAVEAIARKHGFGPWKRRFQGAAAEGTIAGERVLLLLPGTFMNESGRAVGEAANFYKLPLEAIVVLQDEVDLPPGKLRVGSPVNQLSGSSATADDGSKGISTLSGTRRGGV